MPSILKEALEWLNRAEQAREACRKLRSARPSRRYPGCAPEKRVGEGKTGSETGDFFRAFVSQTASASREEVEKNGSAQKDCNSRGASQDH